MFRYRFEMLQPKIIYRIVTISSNNSDEYIKNRKQVWRERQTFLSLYNNPKYSRLSVLLDSQSKQEKEKDWIGWGLSEHGSKRFKHLLLTRDSEAHIMIEPELLLSQLEKNLKLRPAQKRERHNVTASIFTHIHHKMPFRNIHRNLSAAALVVSILILVDSQTRTPLLNLLHHRRLRQFGGHRH